ncbi:asparaginase-domain-containing protein, partial [Linderina pennispora]
SKVLVIYTGGTIGMKHDDVLGYHPVKGYLPERLRSIGRFHDPNGFDDFDLEFQRTGMHTGNTRAAPTGRKSGNASGMASRQGLSVSGPDSSDPRGTGTPGRLSEWLITPRSMYGRRVQYCFLEYDPLLDSCNMDMTDWVRIVTDIEKFYYMFDAFIILHGTDTMAYTAGALSFMLQNLGKSVIVTGSQVPIAEVRNDGIENFLGALTVAGHFVIPEVTLYFSNKLFRGNRCVKIDAMDFEAFGSPNLAPLVKVGVDIEVNWPEVLRPNCIMPFCAHKQMNCNVATLRLFPGISAAAIRAFLAPPIQGIVLETFGAGNAPDTRPNILEALAEASERGVVIVNVTQCQRGNVSDLYATARGLTNARVVPGRDMTSECALTKLSYLLGRGFSPDKCRDMLSRSLRGELTIVQSHKRPIFSSGHVRSNTFAQFVARQILDETQANEADLEPPAMPMSPSIGSSESDLPTVTERASIYRSFFPVLLCTAAATGDLQGMYLLESASNNFLEVTCYDYTGQTPLHCAVRAGQLPCARFLLKRGASVHVLSRMGHTPLFAAILSRHPEMVQLLVNAGAHFSDAETKDLMVSMQNAVTRGDIEFVKLAVRAGFNLDCTDYEGRTVLFFAVIAGQVEIVQYLL